MVSVFARILLLLVGIAPITGQCRNQLNGKHLNVVVLHLAPMMVVKVDSGRKTFSGPLYEQLDWLSKRLNFSYNLYQDERNSIGVKVNGSWNGLMGLLAEKKVDLAAFPFVASWDRIDAMEHTGFFSGDDSVILTNYPHANVSWTAIFRPFSLEVWMGWLVSFAVVNVVCLLILHVCSRHLDSATRFRLVREISEYILGTITNQGGYYRARFHSLGVVVVSWCLLSFVFVNVYNSVLTSSLATWYRAPDINSIQDLADSHTHQLIIVKGLAAETEILAATSGPFKKIGDKLRKCPECRLPTGALETKILRGNYVAFAPSKGLSNIVKNTYQKANKCLLTLAYPHYGWKPQFFGTPKFSPYVEEINRESLWAHAFGLPFAWHSFPEDFEPCRLDYNKKGVEVKSSSHSLSVKEFHPSFILLACGYAMAAIAFIYEFACFKYLYLRRLRRQQERETHPKEWKYDNAVKHFAEATSNVVYKTITSNQNIRVKDQTKPDE